MKVFEILRNDIGDVNEQQLEQRLKKFNWKYEFSDKAFEITRAQQELELLENMTYKLWKVHPEKAVELWWSSSTPAPHDKSVTPSFIYRLQAQESSTATIA